MTDPPAAFNGLYYPSGATAELDDKAALNSGYGYDDGNPGPHGTFHREQNRAQLVVSILATQCIPICRRRPETARIPAEKSMTPKP